MAMAMHELIKLHAASHNITVQLYSTGLRNGGEQAGAELGQAQIKLGLCLTSIKMVSLPQVAKTSIYIPPTANMTTASHFLQLQNTHQPV